MYIFLKIICIKIFLLPLKLSETNKLLAEIFIIIYYSLIQL